MSARTAIMAVVVRQGVASEQAIDANLPTMQAIVGGFVEHVSLRGPWNGLHMWVNETGLIDGLPRSPCPMYPGSIHGDYFVTRVDGEGETVSLHSADVERLLSVLPRGGA